MTCFVPSFDAEMPQTMFVSSLRVAARSISASSAPASRRVSGFVALPSTQITSRLLDRVVMASGFLSITVMSCPSDERVSATE